MRNSDGKKGLPWKLPVLKSSYLGKLEPGFSVGAGCGVGFGIGFIGGVGFGPGIPGLHFGVGFGAGCGVGFGAGYGVGKGIAQDEYRRYLNAGSIINEDIAALVGDIVVNTKKLIKATSRVIDKWGR